MQFFRYLNMHTRHFIPVSVTLSFILLVCMLWLNRRHLYRMIKSADKGDLLALAAIFVLALAARLFLIPHQHHMVTDEHIYMMAGRDMLKHFSQVMYSKAIGWPFILTLCFAFFGISNWVALYASSVLGALTVFPVFFFSSLVTGSRLISLLAASLLAFHPLHLYWSGSAETNVPTLFFVMLSLCFMLMYFRKPDKSLLWLASASVGFASQFRQESYFLFPLFLVGIYLFRKKLLFKDFRNILIALSIAFTLSAPNLIQVIDLHAYTPWLMNESGGRLSGPNWSLGNFVYNTLHFGKDAFAGGSHHILAVFLVLSGMFWAAFSRRREALFLLSCIALPYSIYFSSWLQTIGGRERLFITFYPFYFVFIGYGVAYFNALIRKRLGRNAGAFFLALVLAALSLFYMPLHSVRAEFTSKPHLLETIVPEIAEKEIPQECVIVMALPEIIESTTDFQCFSLSAFLLDEDLRQRIFRSSECVLFYEDFSCMDFWGVPTMQYKDKCKQVKSVYSAKEFKSYSLGSLKYSFYRLGMQESI